MFSVSPCEKHQRRYSDVVETFGDPGLLLEQAECGCYQPGNDEAKETLRAARTARLGNLAFGFVE